MATFAQAVDAEQLPVTFNGVLAGVVFNSGVFGPPTLQVIGEGDQATGVATLTKVNAKGAINPQTWVGQEFQQAASGFDFFESFHVIPRSFDFGNLLSAQSVPIEVYSAYRRDSHTWSTFLAVSPTSGLSLAGDPTLPSVVEPQFGHAMTLEVATVGDAFIDDTLDFTFSTMTIMVPIIVKRIVLWGIKPEMPYTEFLGFLTNVYNAISGKEKRESVRKNPRQGWGFDYIMEEGVEAQTLENLLFDFQSRTFGIPVWHDGSALTAAAAAGATTVTVDSTAFRDYRVGGLVVIFTSLSTFDVLEIGAGGITSTTLTFIAPTVNAYAAGVEVYPLRTCLTTKQISGARWPVGLRRKQIKFTATDNDADLADLSAFSSYKSKLFLDNGNSMLQGTVAAGHFQEFVTVDGEVGLIEQSSTWDRNKNKGQFTLRASGRQAVWEMRQLVHSLKGRWISFYIPSDSDDLTANANLVSGSNTIDVDNVGYTQFVRDRQPKGDIRITFVDGSPPLLREITGSTSPTTTTDTLTVDSNWPSTITPAEIARIEYVEKVRLDTDDVRLEFDASGHRARLVSPIVSLFE
jgi:hypothetical protein